MLARALRYAAAMDERGPARADPAERWLDRFAGKFRLAWVEDFDFDPPMVRSLFVPVEAFEVAEDALAAVVEAARLKADELRDANSAAFDDFVRRILKNEV